MWNPTFVASPSRFAVLAGGICTLVFLPAVHAQTVMNQAAITEALSASPNAPRSSNFGAGLLTAKPLRFNVAPDLSSRLCESPPPQPGRVEGTGASVAAPKNLYVVSAPSVELAVTFDFDRSTLRPEGRTQLDELGRSLQSSGLQGQRFVIAGHTDGQGSAAYNDKLSCDRAIESRNYLRDQHGVDAARLVIMGFGASKLKNPSQPAAEENRRVEIRVVPKESP